MRSHTRDTNQAFPVARVKQVASLFMANDIFVALIVFHKLGLDFVENI
jgi:hypothetical protein